MNSENLGMTTIAPEVICTISRLTTLATPGVSHMSPVRFPYTKNPANLETEGVKVVVKSNQLFIDIYIVATYNINVRMVSENIQQRVLRAIADLTGMEVAQINVHITDIDIEA